MSRRALHQAFVTKFGRLDVKLCDIVALCTRKGWSTGRTGGFEKGQAPHNKGKPCPPGKGGRHPNAQRTQFKKGQLSGAAAAKYKPIGTERITKDGYLERKIHDGMPPQSRWRLIQLIRWEEVNGPLPKGMALKSRDGNRQNTDPANWFPISRALLPRLSGKYGRGYDTAPDELKPSILAIAQLEQRADEVSRRRRNRSVAS
jgi:hypothetical protein